MSTRALAGVLAALAASEHPAQAAPPPEALARPAPVQTAPAPDAPAPVSPAPPAVQAAPSATTNAVQADRAAGISTPVWRDAGEPLELGWHALALPEYLVDLAFSPIGFAVGLVERHRLDRRIIDLLRNDEGTIEVVPAFKFSGGDGLGAGAGLELDNLLGREEQFEMGGLVQLNGDYELQAEYEQTIIMLDGRSLDLSFEYELNHDLHYYGLGNETRPRDRRVIERRGLDALASLEVFARGARDSDGLLQVGFRRTDLGPGIEAGVPPVGEEGDTVAPPQDFGRAVNYGLLALILRHDSRDTPARTQRGVLAEISAGLAVALDGSGSSAVSMRSEVTGFIPLLPLYRALAIRLGLEAVTAPTGDGSIPFDEYVALGRSTGLRGFPNDRFRDEVGWWGSLEYRYPIYRYQDSAFMLSPSLFADVGRVGDNFADLWHPTLHWDVGIGISGDLETSLILRIEVGRSPEGFVTGFTLGKEL